MGNLSAFGKENNCLEGELFMGLIEAWRLLLDMIIFLSFFISTIIKN